MIEFAQLVHETFAIASGVGILLGLLVAMLHTWFA